VKEKALYHGSTDKYDAPKLVHRSTDHITICHGSSRIIEKPIFGEGEPTNDYGLGFYTAFGKEKELAKEWACSPYNTTGIGIVNTYKFNTNEMRILNLDKMDIIYWIVLTATYRKPNINEDNLKLLQKEYLINTELFDCICGWRCDDTFSRIITKFMDNQCTDKAIEEAVHLGHLKQQFVIISNNAFENIHFDGSESIIDFNKYRTKFSNRKAKADKGLEDCIYNNRNNGKSIREYIEELKK